MANIKINDVPQRIQYEASAPSQSAFPIPYPFLANTDILVYQDTLLLSQGGAPGQYGLSGAGSASGGVMTLVTAATVGAVITIIGSTPIDRTSIYSPTISNLTGDDLNSDFNRIIIMMQELWTIQNYMMLQYAPYLEVSQDIDVTTDRWLPILPANHVWRKNDADTEIETALLPANPVGSVGGNFTDDKRLVRTNTDGGLNNIEQTTVEITDANVMQSTAGSWGLDSADDLNLGATGDLNLKGQTWPNTIGPDGTVIGVNGGILEYLNIPTTPNPTTVDVIPKFVNTTGSLDDSQFSEDGTDLLLPADPTQALAAATKQYVDAHTSGVQTVSSGTGIDVDNTDAANPVVNLDSAVIDILDYVVLQNGSPIYGVDAQVTDAYAITLTPAPLAYVDGMEIRFKANTQNTTGATLNVSGLGAVAILKFHDQALATGDIEAGQISTVIYDSAGPSWQLQSAVAATPGSGTVNSGTINQMAWYAATGAAVSGLATANNGVLVTSNTGVPSISSTLPAAVIANIPGRLLNIRYLISGAGATYTPTAGTTSILVELMGAGGGGGGVAPGAVNFAAAGGGGAGGYCQRYITGVTGGYSATYTVPAGGAGGVANLPGAAGGTTTYNDGTFSMTAIGGAGGGAGGVLNAGSIGGFGGEGNGATGGTIITDGGSGGFGICSNVSGNVAQSGWGGNSHFSGGGTDAYVTTATVQAGVSGTIGGGGGGAAGIGSVSTANGGTGGAGIIVIHEFA